MLKTCGVCFKIHDSKKLCKIKRYYKENKQTPQYKKLIKSTRWKKVSEQVKQLDNYNCLACKSDGLNVTSDKLEVHHIIKVNEDITKVYDINNLVTLCILHHKQADNNAISKAKLYSLINKYRDYNTTIII